MFKNLLNILFPTNCNCCQKPLTEGEKIICTYCRHQLSTTSFNYWNENECDSTFYGKTSFVKSSALFYFNSSSVIKELLHQLKYKDQQHLGHFFANWVADVLQKDHCLIHVDYLVPVPLHWRRKQARGYNQLDVFAKHLAQLMGWNYCPKLLKRKNYRTSQTTKNRLKRISDSNPFELNTSTDLSDKNILIVDDLITTGTTMTHCSNAIVKKQSAHIYILSIAFRSRFV